MTVALTEDDRFTLRRALRTLRTSRADARSIDPAVAKAAVLRLSSTVCYVAGFFDGHRIVGMNPGFAGVAGSLQHGHDLDAQLDDLEKAIDDLVTSTRTGLLLVPGLLLAGLGVGLRALGDYVDEE